LRRIYLDNNAMMLPTADHLAEVMQWVGDYMGNASNTHWVGRRAKLVLEKSREAVADLLGAHRSQLVFVSGATEGNYMILSAVFKKLQRSKVLISGGEHVSHWQNAKQLAAEHGLEYIEIPLLASGQVDESALLKALDDDVGYVGLFYVNHETGIKNPISALCPLIKQHAPHCYIHIDAAQALGKEDLSYVASSVVDSLTVSSAKIGGLSGTGAVYIKDMARFEHYMVGGQQERGLRPGTENLAGIISFGLRCRHVHDYPHWLSASRELFAYLHTSLRAIPGVHIHGDMQYSSQLALSFCLKGRSALSLQTAMEQYGIAVGHGSACQREPSSASSVLLSMGADAWQASHSLRVSLSEHQKREDLETFLGVVTGEFY